MTTASPFPEPVRLDVRQLLASGGEPFDLILATVSGLPSNGVLELIAPFEPLPLYPVMQRRGFSRDARMIGPTDWIVSFRETGIVPDATLATIAERHPGTRAVFGKRGLDLCCGGSKTLEVVARAHGIEVDTLIAELQAVTRDDPTS